MSGSRLIATGMSSGRSSFSVTAASDGFASTKIARIAFLVLPLGDHRSGGGRPFLDRPLRPQEAEGQLVPVVRAVEQRGARDGREGRGRAVVGGALELDGADDAARAVRLQPAPHQAEQLLGVA